MAVIKQEVHMQLQRKQIHVTGVQGKTVHSQEERVISLPLTLKKNYVITGRESMSYVSNEIKREVIQLLTSHLNEINHSLPF